MSESKVVTAMFKDRESAEAAYKKVTEHESYGPGDVSLAMSHETRDKHFAHPGMIEEGDSIVEFKEKPPADPDDDVEVGTMAAKGGGIGGIAGGTIGAVAAALAALGTALALPGIGLFIAGPIAAAIAGAGAGAATGGLVGALVGWGIPEEHVKHYEDGLHEGGVLMTIRTRTAEDAHHFMDVLRHHNADHVH
jgi:hypothetical protein